MSGTLVEALNNKLFDTEWNIRDVVINFVGQLFKEVQVRLEEEEKRVNIIIINSRGVKLKFNSL